MVELFPSTDVLGYFHAVPSGLNNGISALPGTFAVCKSLFSMSYGAADAVPRHSQLGGFVKLIAVI